MIDLIEVQKLVFDRLSTLNCPVVDEFVLYGETKTPYVQLGSLYIEDNNTKNSEHMEMIQYINIYSTYIGKKEILEISQAVSNVMKKDRIEYETTYIDSKGNLQEVVYSIYIDEDRKSILLDTDKNGNRFYHAVLIFNLHIN